MIAHTIQQGTIDDDNNEVIERVELWCKNIELMSQTI